MVEKYSRADIALGHIFVFAMPGAAEKECEAKWCPPQPSMGMSAGEGDGFYAGDGGEFGIKTARESELIR